MSLARWLMGIALIVGLGMLLTAQRMAVFMEGAIVGKRMEQLHEQQVRVGWLQQQVVGSASPSSLAQQAQQRRMNLVAWSSLPERSAPTAPSPKLVTTAAADPDQLAIGDNTSD